MKLTPKQAKFVDEYLIDLNATQAAIRAGYSQRTSHSIGWENLKKPQIQTALKHRRDQLAADLNVTPERVIDEYKKIAFFDPRTLFKNRSLQDIEDLDDDVAAAIAYVETTSHQFGRAGDVDRRIVCIKKIRLWDKLKALDALAKHLGLFGKDNLLKTGLAQLLAAIAVHDPEAAEILKRLMRESVAISRDEHQ